MRIEISGLDQRGLNRACHQLDEANVPHASYAATDREPSLLTCESEVPAVLRHFVNVALHDPDAKIYRPRSTLTPE